MSTKTESGRSQKRSPVFHSVLYAPQEYYPITGYWVLGSKQSSSSTGGPVRTGALQSLARGIRRRVSAQAI